ncbi:matrix-remodeling-associated protein 7 [Biomphalaria glabrata]|nr:matrix-remodeling-associated protein 7 [Biomphalaria glabrata]
MTHKSSLGQAHSLYSDGIDRIVKMLKITIRKTNEEIDDQSRPHLSSLETDTDDTLTEARHKRFSQEQTTCSPRYPDPVDYCEHIQGEIKRVQQTVATRSIAKRLTEEQLKEEREVQRKQLAEIFRLMQEQQDRFGIGSMDDMQEQMKLYAVQ